MKKIVLFTILVMFLICAFSQEVFAACQQNGYHDCDKNDECCSGFCAEAYDDSSDRYDTCCNSGQCGRDGRCYNSGFTSGNYECCNGVWKLKDKYYDCDLNSDCCSGFCAEAYDDSSDKYDTCCNPGQCGREGRCSDSGSTSGDYECCNGVWKYEDAYYDCNNNEDCCSGFCAISYYTESEIRYGHTDDYDTCCDSSYECGRKGSCYQQGYVVDNYECCGKDVWKYKDGYYDCNNNEECCSGFCAEAYDDPNNKYDTCCDPGQCGREGGCYDSGYTSGNYKCSDGVWKMYVMKIYISDPNGNTVVNGSLMTNCSISGKETTCFSQYYTCNVTGYYRGRIQHVSSETYSSWANLWYCEPSPCSGSVALTLNPSTVEPGGSVTPSASGLSGCGDKTIYFKKDSCTGTQVSSCIVSGSGCTGSAFTAPSAEGIYTYYACVDKNGDKDFADSGESDSKTLIVSKCNGNNVCESGENCKNCRDCYCSKDQLCCSDGTCKSSCISDCDSDGKCEPGESCTCSDCYGRKDACSDDLVCNSTKKTCQCPSDRPYWCTDHCDISSDCKCGNGVVDSGENCSNCPADAGCLSGKICCSGVCKDSCPTGPCDNNNICDLNEVCDCSDCLNWQDRCLRGLVCSADKKCGCYSVPDGICPNDPSCKTDPDCLACMTNPNVTISPSSQTGMAGETLNYTILIKNNDKSYYGSIPSPDSVCGSSPLCIFISIISIIFGIPTPFITFTNDTSPNNASVCGSSNFTLTKNCPSGWTCNLDKNSVTINSSSTASVEISVKSPLTSAIGPYRFNVTATNNKDTGKKGTDSAAYIVESACSRECKTRNYIGGECKSLCESPNWVGVGKDGCSDVCCCINVTIKRNATIYMYYGNANANSMSNGTATFEFFDDFESWSGWTPYGSGVVSQSSTVAYQGTYSLKKDTNGDPNGACKAIGSTLNFGNGYIFEGRIDRTVLSGYDSDRLSLEDISYNGYGLLFYHNTSESSEGFTVPENSWYGFRFITKPNGDYESQYLGSGDTMITKRVATDTTYSSFDRVCVRGGYPYYVDILKIRKYASPEPSYSIGNEIADTHLPGWTKKKPITINGSGALTDYQVKVIINYDSDMQLDYDDLRFIDARGNNLIYWIENYTTTNATVWIKVPTIPDMDEWRVDVSLNLAAAEKVYGGMVTATGMYGMHPLGEGWTYAMQHQYNLGDIILANVQADAVWNNSRIYKCDNILCELALKVDSSLLASEWKTDHWESIINTTIYHSIVDANVTFLSVGVSGSASDSYDVITGKYILISIKYPYVFNKIIPLTETGEPNFTKTMPIEFLISGTVKDAGNPFYSLDCRENCKAYYDIDGTNWKEVQWKDFEKAFFGSVDSKNLQCDSYHDLNIRIVSEANGTGTSRFYINCIPRLTVNPGERAVVLGTKNIPAFNVTIWNPIDVDKSYSMEMKNADPTQKYLMHWTRFEYNNMVAEDPTDVSNDDKGKTTVSAVDSSSVMVYLTEDASSIAGVYPIKFVATGSRLEGEGVLMVYAEGLNEFAVWQFFALMIMASLLLLIGKRLND